MTEMTPGQADTLTISESTAERDQLAAKLAHALAANERWAATFTDVQQRHAEVKRERDEARDRLARLNAEADALAISHGKLHELAAEIIGDLEHVVIHGDPAYVDRGMIADFRERAGLEADGG